MDRITEQSNHSPLAIYLGPKFQRPFCAVINSHQSLYPSVKHSWIKAVIQAIDTLTTYDNVLIGSAGLTSYELPLWYAGQRRKPQIIVLPIQDLSQADQVRRKILLDFKLTQELTGCLLFLSSDSAGKSVERDRIVLCTADIVYPVSVRRSGRMQRLLSALPPSRIKLDFQLPFEYIRPETESIGQVQPALDNLGRNWLTHWTRRSPQRGLPYILSHKQRINFATADFYQALIMNPESNVYSARHTLNCILESKTILASGQGIRGKFPVISLTDLSPAEMLPLMKWRPARIRFAFEPYGIAIKKTVLKKLGARPVIYGNTAVYHSLDALDKPFYQAEGNQQIWRREREWRIQGNINLEAIPDNAIRILTPNNHEARQIIQRFPQYRVDSLSGE